MKEVSIEEWIKELESLQSESGEGFTAGELAAKVGKTAHWVRAKILTPAKAKGILRTGMALRPDLLNRMRPQPVYRLVKDNTKRK